MNEYTEKAKRELEEASDWRAQAWRARDPYVRLLCLGYAQDCERMALTYEGWAREKAA